MTVMATADSVQEQDRQIPPLESLTKLIYQQANKCWYKLPTPKIHDIDDLANEGRLLYVELQGKYDPERGAKFITLFYTRLWQRYAHILNHACRDIRNVGPLASLEYLDELGVSYDRADQRGEYRHVRLSDTFFKSLSRDAHLFARELLYPGDEFEAWQRDNYTNKSHSPITKKRRLVKFFQLTKREERKILLELQVKLSAGCMETC